MYITTEEESRCHIHFIMKSSRLPPLSMNAVCNSCAGFTLAISWTEFSTGCINKADSSKKAAAMRQAYNQL